ncbi:MAG TPA: hypothetical protein VF719_03055 [Abditibacteriaceae bacterium]
MRLIIIGSTIFIVGLELSIPDNHGSLSFMLQEIFRMFGVNIRNRGFSNIFSSLPMLIGLPLALRGVAQLAAELTNKMIESRAGAGSTEK